MKVKRLIKELQKFDPNSEVVMQKDSEGNGYSPLVGVDPHNVYVKENSYSGEVYSSKWTADDACMTESEWKNLLKKNRCVVLYPMN